jgi:hypothetical protein
VEGWKNGRMEEWKGGRMEEWKGGRMEGCKSGRVEGWKDGARHSVSYAPLVSLMTKLSSQVPVSFLL